MAKKAIATEPTGASSPAAPSQTLREPAECLFALEIAELIANDKHDKPPGWNMSARAVHTYICGGKAGRLEITPKYIGHPRLVEIAL